MSRTRPRRRSVDDLLTRIRGTLVEIHEAVAAPAKMEWFRARVREAVEHARRKVETEAQLKAEKEAHARMIWADRRAGRVRYTRKRQPPDRRGWVRRSAVFYLRRRCQRTVLGWFPERLMQRLDDLWTTPAGSAAVLAWLHDWSLVERAELDDTTRIVADQMDRVALTPDGVLLAADCAAQAGAADQIALRWRDVKARMEAELHREALARLQVPEAGGGRSGAKRKRRRPNANYAAIRQGVRDKVLQYDRDHLGLSLTQLTAALKAEKVDVSRTTMWRIVGAAHRRRRGTPYRAAKGRGEREAVAPADDLSGVDAYTMPDDA